jgi:signal transduction histidine kinase
MENPRILVVDDDSSLLTALTAALQLRMPEVDVETVDSGVGALQELAVSEFDAVITDIKMPGMDGLTLLGEIRQMDPHLPTLLITGHGQHDLAVHALRGGAFDFIQKPIDRDYLVAALTRAIQVRRLHRQVQSQQQTLARHATELEQVVKHRTQKLKEINQRKDQFLAMLAHELRNPLACIRYAVDLLSFPTDGQTCGNEELLESMSRQVTHMSHLLSDLLDVSRISRNQITLNKTHVDLTNILKTATDAMRPTLDEFYHVLTADLPDKPVVVDGDETRLEQIFVNLLNNAAKYTDPGGRIELALRSQNDQALIEIKDNGIGISSEMLPRVFELFSQADCSMDRSKGGLGIGLTLVENLVQLHGGSVIASSEGEGKGSTFTVRLPVLRAQESQGARPAAFHDSSTRFRVMVVEDNTALARLTRHLLQKCGQEVVSVVSDGLAAIDAAQEHRPEIILLDLGIPKLDGYEVARRLRQFEQFKNLKIIALTGYGQAQDRLRSKEAGIDHHLTKPVSIQALSELFSTTAEQQFSPS